MGITWTWVSVSLDGFITGPDDNAENPMGINGESLHEWMFAPDRDPTEQKRVDKIFSSVGAVVMGRRMFDLGIDPWGNENPFAHPVFVATHRPREPFESPNKPPINFVDSFHSAIAQAISIAGEADVLLAGGAAIFQQALAENVVDELRIALVPVLLGSGRPLFKPGGHATARFELINFHPTPAATHLTYRPIT